MNDTDRIIGRLEQFQETTEDRLDCIEDKLDSLTQSHWKRAGGITVLAFLLTAAVEFVHIYKGN